MVNVQFFSVEWIVGLGEHKQQFCQSRSWIELGSSVSLLPSTRPDHYVPSISLPSRARGITLACTDVGFEKFSFATACRSLESKPKVLKLWVLLSVSAISTPVGTSSSLSFRFMDAI